MDLSTLINSFTTGTYTVTRRATGGFKRGIAQPTTDTVFVVAASVQPAKGTDLLRLPEERRSNQTRVVFTTVKLTVGSEKDGTEADYLTIDGELWEVQHVEQWLQPGVQGTGYRCIMQQPSAS